MFVDDYLEFGKKWLNIHAEIIHAGKVLEVSFRDNFRSTIERMNPKSYFNVSPKLGPGADKELNPYELTKVFEKNYFDVVICDLLQYMKDWKRVVWSITTILNVRGLLIVASRSVSHNKEYAADLHWRFTTHSLYEVFRGFSIEELKECSDDGALFVGVKREIWTNDISSILAQEVR